MADDNLTGQVDILPTDSSLSDALEGAFDRINEGKESPLTDQGASQKAVPAAQEGEKSPSEGRVRDASGRFAPKQGETAEGDAQKVAETPTTAKTAEGTVATPIGTAATVATHGDAPQSWAPELRPHWAAVPEAVKTHMHKREAEMQAGMQQSAQARTILQEFVPYAEQLQKEGATPAQAIRQLLQTAHQLQSGGPEYKKAIWLSLAQQYGIDTSQPVNMELARAQAQVANMSTERMYGNAQTYQAQEQQVMNDYNSFARDPQNEFFEQVKPIMGSLIGSGVAKNLREAYDYAVGMNPTVRQTLISRAVEQDGMAKRQAAAANVSVRGAPGGVAGGTVRKEAPGEIGTSIRDAMERHGY